MAIEQLRLALARAEAVLKSSPLELSAIGTLQHRAKCDELSAHDCESAVTLLLASPNEYALLAAFSVIAIHRYAGALADVVRVCYRAGVSIRVKVAAAGMLESLTDWHSPETWLACSPLLLEALASEQLAGGDVARASASATSIDEVAAMSAGGRLEESTATWQRSESALVLLRALIRGDTAAITRCAQAGENVLDSLGAVGVAPPSPGLSTLLSASHVARVEACVLRILTAATAAASHYVREAAYHAADSALQWLSVASRAAEVGESPGSADVSAVAEAAEELLPACIDAIACGLEDEHPQVRFAASSAMRTLLTTHEFRLKIVCPAALPRFLPALAFNRYLGSERQRYFHQDVWKCLVLADDIAPLLVQLPPAPSASGDASSAGSASSAVAAEAQSDARPEPPSTHAAAAAARRRAQAAWRRAVPAAPAEAGRDRASSPLRSASLAATITSAVGGSSGSGSGSGSIAGGAGSPGRPAFGRAVSPLPGGASTAPIASNAPTSSASSALASLRPMALAAPPSPPLVARASVGMPPSHVPLPMQAGAGARSPAASAALPPAAASAPSSVTLPAAVAAGSAAGPRLVALYIARVVDFYLAQAGVNAASTTRAATTASTGVAAGGAGASAEADGADEEPAPHPDVQEAACNCCAELAVKIDATAVRPHVQRIATALLRVAAGADDWRPRDVAVVALGRFYACFPQTFAGDARHASEGSSGAGAVGAAAATTVGAGHVSEQQLFRAWIRRCFDVHRAVRDHAASVIGEAARRIPTAGSAESAPRMEVSGPASGPGIAIATDVAEQASSDASSSGTGASSSDVSAQHPLVLMAQEARRRVAALQCAPLPSAVVARVADAPAALLVQPASTGTVLADAEAEAVDMHTLAGDDVTAVDGIMFLLRELAGPAPGSSDSTNSSGGSGGGAASLTTGGSPAGRWSPVTSPGGGRIGSAVLPGRSSLIGPGAAAASANDSSPRPATAGTSDEGGIAVSSLSARLAGAAAATPGGVVPLASPADSPAAAMSSSPGGLPLGLGLGLGLGQRLGSRGVRGGDGAAAGAAGAAGSGPLAQAASALDECLPRALALLGHRDCPTGVQESSCRIILDIAQVRQSDRQRSTARQQAEDQAAELLRMRHASIIVSM